MLPKLACAAAADAEEREANDVFDADFCVVTEGFFGGRSARRVSSTRMRSAKKVSATAENALSRSISESTAAKNSARSRSTLAG